MVDEIVTFLKDNLKFFYLESGILLSMLILNKINSTYKSRYIKIIINTLSIMLFTMIFAKIYLTKNYTQFWNLLFVLCAYYLHKIIPKLVKWYDKKTDNFIHFN